MSMSYRTMGAGPGLVLVGGALRTAADYVPLAEGLARSCTVHLVERLGSTLDSEVGHLLGVVKETGARLAFGHSYGGLVVLETARRHAPFERIAVYEPGVPAGPVPTGWMEPYRRRLEANDEHGAFAHFIRGSGGAPAFMAKMPQWYLRLALKVGFRGAAWQRMRPLLAANLVEHREVAAQAGRLAGFAAVAAPALVLCGSRTGRAMRSDYEAVAATLPGATLVTLPGLNHFGPEGKTAPVVAEAVADFLRSAVDAGRGLAP
jgi:pimeloyl-ACP methyl ester carboxylesterase